MTPDAARSKIESMWGSVPCGKHARLVMDAMLDAGDQGPVGLGRVMEMT
jgi:hypothetical protein